MRSVKLNETNAVWSRSVLGCGGGGGAQNSGRRAALLLKDTILKAGDFAREVVGASPMLGGGGAVGGFRRCAILVVPSGCCLASRLRVGVFFFLLHLTPLGEVAAFAAALLQCNQKTHSKDTVRAQFAITAHSI